MGVHAQPCGLQNRKKNQTNSSMSWCRTNGGSRGAHDPWIGLKTPLFPPLTPVMEGPSPVMEGPRIRDTHSSERKRPSLRLEATTSSKKLRTDQVSRHQSERIDESIENNQNKKPWSPVDRLLRCVCVCVLHTASHGLRRPGGPQCFRFAAEE